MPTEPKTENSTPEVERPPLPAWAISACHRIKHWLWNCTNLRRGEAEEFLYKISLMLSGAYNESASPSPEAPAEWMRAAGAEIRDKLDEDLSMFQTEEMLAAIIAKHAPNTTKLERRIAFLEEAREAAEGRHREELQAQHAPACEADKPAWRTMEDAPRDGTKVLLYWPYWRNGVAVIGWFIAGEWDSDCVLAIDGEQPTHWMPLPAPPAAAKEGE